MIEGPVLQGEPMPQVGVWVSDLDGRWLIQIDTDGADVPNIKIDLNDGRIWDAGLVQDDVQGPKGTIDSLPTQKKEGGYAGPDE